MSLQLSSRELKLIHNASATVLSPARFGSEEQWHMKVMETFARLTGAYKVGLRFHADGDYRMVPLGFEASAVSEYREYYHRFDFGRALGGESARGSHVLSNLQHFAGRIAELRRSEYFCDYIRRYKVFDTIALSTRRSQHQMGTVIYLWHEREMTSSQRAHAIAMMGLLGPAFRSGMSAASKTRDGASLLTAIDAMSDGCALFSSAGVLLHRNPSLSVIIADCLDSEALKGLIAAAVSRVKILFFNERASSSAPGQTPVEHRVGAETYRISAVALSESWMRNHPAILVTVVPVRSHQMLVPRPEIMQVRFGLTDREVEVAMMLRNRKTNHEVAERLGVSVHTARHHTENVLRKLGVAARREVAGRVEDNPPS